MLKKLSQIFHDMGQIKVLCQAAERIANAEHQRAPGAEHFVLAALELPDGSAARVFHKLGIRGEDFHEALRNRHRAALKAAGVSEGQIVGSEQNVPPLPRPKGVYNAAPSGEALLQGLAALRKRGVRGPLLGVHVLQVASTNQDAATATAFRLLGRDMPTVMAAIESEASMAA